MKCAAFVTGFIFSLFLGAAYGMDEMPSEVLEYGVGPQLDEESLKNFGRTNQANTEIAKKVRENARIPKHARFSCPSAKEAIQASGTDSAKPMFVTIRGTVWKRGPVALSKAPLAQEPMPEAFLKDILISATALTCRYESEFFLQKNLPFFLQRKFNPSEWKILPATCKPLDPAYQAQVKVTPPKAPSSYYTLGSIAEGTPFPDGLEIICDQEKNKEQKS